MSTVHQFDQPSFTREQAKAAARPWGVVIGPCTPQGEGAAALVRYQQNVAVAEEAARRLWRIGVGTVCPHLNNPFFDIEPQDHFREFVAAVASRADFVVALPGYTTSNACLDQAAAAQRFDVPVFEWPDYDRDPEGYGRRVDRLVLEVDKLAGRLLDRRHYQWRGLPSRHDAPVVSAATCETPQTNFQPKAYGVPVPPKADQ